MLIQHLHERDASCPRCGYNLRNLTQPRCPECKEELRLIVGLVNPRILWFIAAIAPGIFSGIAAFFLLIPIVLSSYVGGNPVPPLVLAADTFGWTSGVFAIFLIVNRLAFLRKPERRQITWAAIIWAIHVAALATLICLIIILN